MNTETTVADSAAEPGRCVRVEDWAKERHEKSMLASANARMRAELAAAATIQRSSLPRQSPLIPGVRFAWKFEPCAELAGDSLNVVRLDEDRLGVSILDVSGHGLAAAMLSIAIQRFLGPPSNLASLLYQRDAKAALDQPVSPAEVLHRLNQLFPMDPVHQQFFTMIYGILDIKRMTFQFASAGHCPPILLREDGTPVEIAANGVPIGILPATEYDEQTLTLQAGSRILLYSDGLTDAEDRLRTPFGTPRLMQALAATRGRPLQEAVSSVLGEAKEWSASGKINDDVSLLLIEVGP